jgi:hypothetical protein
VAFKD